MRMAKMIRVVCICVCIGGIAFADVHYNLTIENNSGRPIRVSKILEGHYSDIKEAKEKMRFDNLVVQDKQSLELYIHSFVIGGEPNGQDLLKISCIDEHEKRTSILVIDRSSINSRLMHINKKKNQLNVVQEYRQCGVGYRIIVPQLKSLVISPLSSSCDEQEVRKIVIEKRSFFSQLFDTFQSFFG
jgi:hypothetical protein